MCDQTEVIYSPGDIVWVKLGPVWWPGQVHDYDKLPEEITSNLRKKPIAVVKFFQEDSYEYVKNLNSIYHYNCRRKHEFIKKGLDVIRSNTRDVPSNMKMFPNDITTAEKLTHGNTDILQEEEFAPKEKEDYSELFGKKTPKRGKDSAKKDTSSRTRDSLTKSTDRRSLPSLTSSGNRVITHRRFITKALEGKSDHEVRIRSQALERDRCDDSKLYNCHLCGFSSSRINVIVLHNKSHSAGFADAYLHPQKLSGKSGKKAKGDKRLTFSGDKRQRVYDTSKSDEPVAKKKATRVSKVSSDQNENMEKIAKEDDSVNEPAPAKKPVFGRKKSAKTKAEKLAREREQSDEFRKNLLKDWDDEDVDDDVDDSKVDTSNDKDSSADITIVKEAEETDSYLTKPKETSCFDFDDSEDGLNIGETVMKFGQKIPRILEKSRKSKDSGSDQLSLSAENIMVTDEDAVEPTEFNTTVEKDTSEAVADPDAEAFESLLDETAVPTLPMVPTHLDIKKFSDLETEGSNINVVSTCSNSQVIDSGGDQIDDGGRQNASVIIDEYDKSIVGVELTHDVTGTSVSNEYETTNREEIKTKDNDALSESENFLVKTSEEVATSSSDDVHLESSVSPIKNNVASVDKEIGNDLLRKSKDSLEIDAASNIPESNMIVTSVLDFEAIDHPARDVYPVDKNNSENKTDNNKLSNEDPNVKLVESTATISVEEETVESMIKLATDGKSGISPFQEIDFDINSMPVIIGDDMVTVEQQPTATSISDTDTLSHTAGVQSLAKDQGLPFDNDLIRIKSIRKSAPTDRATTNTVNMVVKEEISYGSQGKDKKLPTKKLILSPTSTVATTRAAQVATIKMQPSTSTSINRLTVPGSIITQKGVVGGTTSQVLILKSATAGGKSTLQKLGTTSQMIQQGEKVLILTNPQGTSGQAKLLTQKNVPASSLGSTRILTTKGTVLTTASPVTSTKANLLPTKTVTTKSGQKILINNKGTVLSPSSKSVIINKGGLVTTVGPPAVMSSKSPLNIQHILTTKDELPSVVRSHVNFSPFTSVSSKGATTTNIITASGLATNKANMVLTPVSIGKNASIAGQKLKLITSKSSANMTSGTKLMVQTTPSRVILPSSSLQKNQLKLVGNLKNQPNSNTILIQTSQGVIATTPLTSSQMVTKTKTPIKSATPALVPTVMSSKPSSIHMAQGTLQSPNKLVVQKVKAGPNILQKSQRRPAQRSKRPSNQLLTSPQQDIQTAVLTTPSTIGQDTVSVSSSSQDSLILSSTSGLPMIGQSGIVANTQLESSNQPPALVYLTVDESGNYRSLDSTRIMASTDSQTLYIDPGSSGADLDNIFLAIDEAGNVVNISQPVQTQNTTYSTENCSPPPSQDILAKALADTQVLQQETLADNNLSSDNTTSVDTNSLSNCMFVEQPSQYPQQTLSHSVLETSLTLNQPPIMTPLEVPSAVSPGSLSQLSSLPSGFITDSTLMTSATKDNKTEIHQSMPLLTEETNCSSGVKNDTVFFTQVDGSHAVLTPVSSGSQLSFQLALDGSNVIVSSPGLPSLGGVISNSAEPHNSFTTGDLSSDNKQPIEFISIAQDSGTVGGPHFNSEIATDASTNNDLSVQRHTKNSSDNKTITKASSFEEIEQVVDSDKSESLQQSTEIKIKIDCADVTIEPGDHHTGLVSDVAENVVADQSVAECFENITTEVAYSNGDITKRVVNKRLSDDAAGLIVSENGSEYKRVKLDER